MYKRLCDFLAFIEEQTSSEKFAKMSEEEKEKLIKELLVHTQFFQHERLIHLIVTHLFALSAIIILVALVYFKSISILMLFIMIMVLLFPYIIHYYHLENGTQKLYTYYDKLTGRSFGEQSNAKDDSDDDDEKDNNKKKKNND